MATKPHKIDQLFLYITISLVVLGFFIFISASLGLYATEGLSLTSMAMRQFFFGIVGGFVAMALLSQISYTYWKKFALPIFIISLATTALVFIPGIGYTHGGATRWVDLGFASFQPAELLKVGFVIYYAGWCAHIGDKIKTVSYGIIPFIVLLGLVGIVLLAQPDTGSFLVIALTAVAIFIASGARWSHIGSIILTFIAGIGALAWFRPYVQERIATFLNPASDPFGAGYQIKQSLIAVGSGQWLGRGMGQSIQKFNFVPEPMSDSIFAVFAEEWGFVGAVVLIGLFIALALRGYKIAADAPDKFSRLLVVGLITLIVAQSFINMGSMLGIMPLTGLPLIFVSHGGTALLVTLASVGIMLNVSRYS